MSYYLASLTFAIAASLTSQTKVRVVYGDEGFGRVVESGPHVQVLEDTSGDTFEPAPTTQGGIDPTRFRKWTGVLVKIKGASTKSGAKIADHRGVVEAVADLFVITLQEVAHQHKQNVRNVSGTTVDDFTDEVGKNPATAYYELRFQVCRALNKAKAIASISVVVESAVIAHRMVVAETEGAAITNVTEGVATVSGLSGIDSSFIGKVLTLAGGATAANNGDFSITATPDDSSVQITNASASLDTGLTWSVSDDESAQES